MEDVYVSTASFYFCGQWVSGFHTMFDIIQASVHAYLASHWDNRAWLGAVWLILSVLRSLGAACLSSKGSLRLDLCWWDCVVGLHIYGDKYVLTGPKEQAAAEEKSAS